MALWEVPLCALPPDKSSFPRERGAALKSKSKSRVGPQEAEGTQNPSGAPCEGGVCLFVCWLLGWFGAAYMDRKSGALKVFMKLWRFSIGTEVLGQGRRTHGDKVTDLILSSSNTTFSLLCILKI